MPRNQEKVSAPGMLVLLFVLLNTVVLEQSFLGHDSWNKVSVVSFPLLVFSIFAFKRQQR